MEGSSGGGGALAGGEPRCRPSSCLVPRTMAERPRKAGARGILGARGMRGSGGEGVGLVLVGDWRAEAAAESGSKAEAAASPASDEAATAGSAGQQVVDRSAARRVKDRGLGGGDASCSSGDSGALSMGLARGRRERRDGVECFPPPAPRRADAAHPPALLLRVVRTSRDLVVVACMLVSRD